mgnify:CR=1 FL=1
MTWLTSFPQLKSAWLRELQRVIDDGFRSFTRSHGDMIEGLFSPLQTMLIWFERLLLGTPWLLVLAVVAALAWGASRSLRVVIGSVLTLVLIGLFGMWDDTMKTISMVLAATLLSIAIGLPLGILMGAYKPIEAFFEPFVSFARYLPASAFILAAISCTLS